MVDYLEILAILAGTLSGLKRRIFTVGLLLIIFSFFLQRKNVSWGYFLGPQPHSQGFSTSHPCPGQEEKGVGRGETLETRLLGL